jgi:hypothetical protein
MGLNTVPSNKFGIKVGCDLYLFCLLTVGRLFGTDSCQ